MGKKLYFIFIILYTSLLLYWMFFGFGRTPNVEKTVQLVPFTTIYKMFTQVDDFKYFSVNIIGNIVVFIPFGFLGIVFEKLKKAKFLFPVFILGICFIEFLQFITKRGYAEIDDVILNTMGVAIGFEGYKLLSKFFKIH